MKQTLKLSLGQGAVRPDAPYRSSRSEPTVIRLLLQGVILAGFLLAAVVADSGSRLARLGTPEALGAPGGRGGMGWVAPQPAATTTAQALWGESIVAGRHA